MKYLAIIMGLLLGNQTGTDAQHINQASSKDFIKIIREQKGTLLDVRTGTEFRNGHLEGSGNLNYYAFDFRKRLLLLPKDQPVFLYCNTGYRSAIAARYLKKNGYTNVVNLEHGIMEWESLDFPVIVEPDAVADTDNSWHLADYRNLVNDNRVVMIDFYAPWCSPCRQMMPITDKLRQQYHSSAMIVKVNVDASKKLVKELGIKTVPYFMIIRDGEIVFEKDGIIAERKLESELNKHIAKAGGE